MPAQHVCLPLSPFQIQVFHIATVSATSPDTHASRIGMPLTDLPSRREESAPSFTTDQPEELVRYFDDLHFLFLRHNVANQQERKEATCMYTSIRTEQLWKTTEAWLNQAQSYEDFKTEVLKLYPGALGSRTHTLQELEWTVGCYAHIGIQSAAELGEYYRQYLLITRYLIAQGSISDIEQSRGFFRGLQLMLEVRIRERLQLKFINHFPDDPYPLSDIFEAADFILRSSVSPLASPRSQPHPLAIPAISDPSPANSDEITVKIDALIAGLTERLQRSLEDKIASAVAEMSAPNSLCCFCGGAGHFVCSCEVVEDFVRSGKCKRHPDGKIVLPTGAMAPHGAPNSLLCDHIKEWHQWNPGNTEAQLFYGIVAKSPGSAAMTHVLSRQLSQQHPVTSHHIHPHTSSKEPLPDQQRVPPPHLIQLTAAINCSAHQEPPQSSTPTPAPAHVTAKDLQSPRAADMVSQCMLETPVIITQ